MSEGLTAECPKCGCQYDVNDVGQLVRCKYCDEVFTRFNNFMRERAAENAPEADTEEP